MEEKRDYISVKQLKEHLKERREQIAERRKALSKVRLKKSGLPLKLHILPRVDGELLQILDKQIPKRKQSCFLEMVIAKGLAEMGVRVPKRFIIL